MNATDDLPLFTPQRPAFLPAGRMEDDFWNFHLKNPQVYALLGKPSGCGAVREVVMGRMR